MSMQDKNVHHLTQEWYNKLKEELRILKEEKLPDVLRRLKEAAEQWDISENAEYETALAEKDQIEIRISQIEEILSNAVIIDESQKSKNVTYGSKVKFEDDKGKIYEVTLVWTWEVDVLKWTISFHSPLGIALKGKKAWDKATVKAPKWHYQIKILEVK